MTPDLSNFALSPRRPRSSLNISAAPIGGGVAPAGTNVDVLQSQFDEEHPFMPSSSFTAPFVPTNAPGAAPAAGLYPNTQQAGEAQAMLAATSPVAYNGGGWGRPTGDNIVAGGGGWGKPTLAPSPTAAGGLYPQGAMTAAGRTHTAMAPTSPNYGMDTDPTVSPVLQAAQGLQQIKTQAVRDDTLAQMTAAGTVPTASDDRDVRQNKMNYLTKRMNQDVAVASGIASELPKAPGTPQYTGNRALEVGGVATRSDGQAPKPTVMDLVQGKNTTSLPADKYAGAADAAAGLANRLQQQAGQPHWIEDPVTGERKLIYGKDVVNSGTNPKNAQYPRTVTAGNRKLIEVSTGKFTDDKGTPVEWRDGQDKPLTVNEFLMSPVLSGKFNNDYSTYRAEFKKQSAQAEPPTPPQLSPIDQEAVDWARANPSDKRSAAILQRHGMK